MIKTKKGQEIIIKDIYENRTVLEEWRAPGKYSPVNIFDDNNSTCFAEGGRHWFITLSMETVDPVICDEIRILGGLSKNKDIFLKNNRPKEIIIYFSKSYDKDWFLNMADSFARSIVKITNPDASGEKYEAALKIATAAAKTLIIS